MSIENALKDENVSFGAFVSTFQKEILLAPCQIVSQNDVFKFIKKLMKMRQHLSARLTSEMACGPFNRDRAPYYFTTSNMKGLKRIFIKPINSKEDVVKRCQLTEEQLQREFRFVVGDKKFAQTSKFIQNKDVVLVYFEEKELAHA